MRVDVYYVQVISRHEVDLQFYEVHLLSGDAEKDEDGDFDDFEKDTITEQIRIFGVGESNKFDKELTEEEFEEFDGECMSKWLDKYYFEDFKLAEKIANRIVSALNKLDADTPWCTLEIAEMNQ